MPYDLIIRHATLISGDGSDRFEADLAVDGDRIAAIRDLSDAHGKQEIDAAGKIVAPGFIDVHTMMTARCWCHSAWCRRSARG